MPKRPIAYFRPKRIEEALRRLSEPNTVPLAGGTKLLAGDVDAAVVDLQDLGLNKIVFEEGWLRVGATAKLRDISDYLANNLPNREDDGKGWSPLLRKAIKQAGPNTYRNAATLGGITASRLADSELLAALLTLNAEVTMEGASPESLSLSEYLSEAEHPPGLITAVRIRWEDGKGRSVRVARTPADYPIVSVTLWQALDKRPSLAATGIDARPIRLTAAESVLSATFDEQAIERAAEAAASHARHPGDFRGSAAYRAEMVAVLTRRVLQSAS